MKKIITLLLLPLLAITFIACKDKEEEKKKPTKLVKTIEWIRIFENDTMLFTHYYDNQNRLIKREELYRNIVCSITFKYSTNTITVYPDNDPFTWYLDESGYLIGDDNNFTYTYENGYLKEWKAEAGFGLQYSWMNGNNIQIADIMSPTGTIIYEYNNKEDLLNIEPLWVFQHLHPLPIYGLKLKGWTSKNCVVKRIQTNTNPDYPPTTIYDYDYHFDLDGYPTQIIMKENNQVESKLIFTYY